MHVWKITVHALFLLFFIPLLSPSRVMKKKSRFDDISRTGDCTYAQPSFGLISLHGMYVCDVSS